MIDRMPPRIAGKTISRIVATVARRWIGDSPRSGDRSYGRNTEVLSPTIPSRQRLDDLVAKSDR
jgi:hypothetical protein